MKERGLSLLVVAFLLACSSAAPPAATGGEGGAGEEGGSGGTVATGGKPASGGSGGSGGTTVPDAAPAVEKDAGPPAADVAGSADQAPSGEGGSSGGGEALMIVGSIPTIGSDVQIKEQLIGRGLKVTEVLDNAATAEMAAGKKIVVLSYSIDTKRVTPKFGDVEACIILLEHNLLPTLGMTAASAGAHGYKLPSTQISIVNPTHPLAAGFMGDVTVISVQNGDVFWGVPAESAIKIATVKGAANHFVLFAYEKDAMMVGRKAAGKRLQFFLGAHNVPTRYLAPNGLKMLDASIDWCVK